MIIIEILKLMKKVDNIDHLIYNYIVIEVETSVSHLLTDGLQVCTLFFLCAKQRMFYPLLFYYYGGV